MRVIEQLAELASSEAELAQAEEALAQIEARATGDPEVRRLDAERAERDASAARATAQRRAEELELEALAQRLQHQERALYDGSVRHPGDLQRRQHELDGLRERRAALEERVLAAMEAEEAAASVLADAAQRARLAAERAAGRRAADLDRRPGLERAAAAAADRRAHLRAEVPEPALRLYQRTAARRTPPVARVVHGICSGCRLPVPPRVLDQARHDELAVCETCERLLLL